MWKKMSIIFFLFFLGIALSVIYFLINSKILNINKLGGRDIKVKEIKNTKTKEEYTLWILGDTMLGRSINTKAVRLNDFLHPFRKTAELIGSSDITFSNLESPFNEDCPITDTGMVFCADKRFAQGLKFAGIDIVSIANNHIGNQGDDGISYTKELLNSVGIKSVGDHNFEIIEVRGKKFGFLAYNHIFPDIKNISWVDDDTVRKEVSDLKKIADFVVVSFHFGVEYKLYPTKEQMQFAHTAIDSGADLVVGHHPHWVQGTEVYKNKYIFYSLGNYIFDQLWSKSTMEGLTAKITIGNDNAISNVSLVPVIMEKSFQTRLANEAETKLILEKVKRSSSNIMEQSKNLR